MLLLALVVTLQDNTIELCIEQLHSEKPEVRETAAKQLRKLGAAAQPALETAAKASDSEVAQRAQDILKHINADLAQAELARLRAGMEKAKTIQVRFEGEWNSADGDKRLRKELRGYWAVGTGGKAYGDFSWKNLHDDSSHRRIVFVSDGSRMIGGHNGDLDQPFPSPATLQRDLASGLSTLGAAYSMNLLLKEPLGWSDPQLPCARPTRLSGIQLLAGKEAGVKELIYKVHEGPDNAVLGPPVLESHLWFDGLRGIPLRRTIRLYADPSGDPETIISEKYTEFTYDQEIPEGRFEISRTKK